jgi:hypothetical protein
MGQHINEPGSDRLPFGVDLGAGVQVGARPHVRDVVAVDRHITGKGCAAGAIVDLRIADHDIVRRGHCSAAAAAQGRCHQHLQQSLGQLRYPDSKIRAAKR